jgi:hypothetical protein
MPIIVSRRRVDAIMTTRKDGNTRKIGRDASTGKFIPVKEALKRPKTTVIEVIKTSDSFISSGKPYNIGIRKGKISNASDRNNTFSKSGTSLSIRTTLGITDRDIKVAKKVLSKKMKKEITTYKK